MSIAKCSFNIPAAVGLVLVLTGCAKPTTDSQPTPPPAAELDLAGAAQQVAADIAKQIGAGGTRPVAVDPLLDRVTGQQTNASLRAQEELMTALAAAAKNLTVGPMSGASVEQTGLVATGTVGIVAAPDQFVLSVALTDRANGIVIAQSAARFRQASMDSAPTSFYSDSPSLVRDRSVDGYVKTAETPRGSLADPLYVEQLPTAALIASALSAYNAGRWEEALTGYTAAAARPDGQNLRTFNGLYLTNIRLGRTAAAEEAFGKIAALGLATNNLAVKLLFRPGTTDFLVDRTFSGAYPMWIRQIARAARTSKSCLNIIGHTSASGTSAVNDPLSLSRATAVRSLLDKEGQGLERRLSVTGVGSRRNIVGTGADDASDAIDRRVEFEVQPCKP